MNIKWVEGPSSDLQEKESLLLAVNFQEIRSRDTENGR